MNQEIKKEWVEALRSGEYKQGKQRLYRPNEKTYCCLGVLCDLHAKKFDNSWWMDNDNNAGIYDGSFNVLPDSVFKWADLPVPSVTSLINMNDGGSTFSEIADYIERRL